MRYLLLIALAACFPTSGADDSGNDTTTQDVAQYDELADRLDLQRRNFLGNEADELQAGAKRIFWLQYASFDPTIHSSMTGARINYGFRAGTEGNVRGSDDIVATATREGDTVTYRAYAAGAANSLRGEIDLPAPSDEQRWWAYAVDEKGDVYIVTTGDKTRVVKWTPGAAPATVAVLEEHGVAVGIFLDLMVYRGRMLFNESGRLWTMDLATLTATWVGNKKQISGAVSTDGTGVLYTAADGPYHYLAGGTREIRDEIEKSGYRLNKTFASAHLYADHAVLWKGYVIYKGQAGMFAFDLKTRSITPLLLEPRSTGKRIVYIDPQIVDDAGILYITGLESDNGAVGADGPVYAVDLNAALH